MSSNRPLGGVIHTYQKYDPKEIPSPLAETPDMVSPAFEHMLRYGSLRDLTEEELARAIKLDPSQIAGLGPSLDMLRALLEERKRKILETYETEKVVKEATSTFHDAAEKTTVPDKFKQRFNKAIQEEQLDDLERLWYLVGNEKSQFSRDVMRLIATLGEQYQVEELASKYTFTGRESMTVPQALEIKAELEQIDKLLEQLKEASETAQLAIIDMSELAKYAEPGDMERLEQMQKQVEEMMRHLAEQQGLEQNGRGFQLTPQAYKIFQSRLLTEIFSELNASRTGRHEGPIAGEGAVETPRTKQYEFGDSVSQMDIGSSMVNALLRGGPHLPIRMKPEDIEIHQTRNNPKCATCVCLDMSGSMRYDGLYVHVKRMGLALDGLIRKEYPGDYLQFIEMYSLAKPRHISEIATLMPKPVTIYDPIVRLKADLSDPNVSEALIPPHFTNIQRALQLGRTFLASRDTPNKQLVVITDGLPTAHFEGELLYLLYPPDPRTEEATMREAQKCAKDGITINIFLLPSWSQSREDVAFAYRMAESTKGRVFFTAGRDLDRFVLHDYIHRRKRILS